MQLHSTVKLWPVTTLDLSSVQIEPDNDNPKQVPSEVKIIDWSPQNTEAAGKEGKLQNTSCAAVDFMS